MSEDVEAEARALLIEHRLAAIDETMREWAIFRGVLADDPDISWEALPGAVTAAKERAGTLPADALSSAEVDAIMLPPPGGER